MPVWLFKGAVRGDPLLRLHFHIIDAIQKGWAKKWQANHWMRNAKEPALNADLWEQLLGLLERHPVTFVWVKGHAGHPENERCDQLAVQASMRAAGQA